MFIKILLLLLGKLHMYMGYENSVYKPGTYWCYLYLLFTFVYYLSPYALSGLISILIKGYLEFKDSFDNIKHIIFKN